MLITGGTDAYDGDPDGWTLRTADGTRAAHVEPTVAITQNGPEILTQLARTQATPETPPSETRVGSNQRPRSVGTPTAPATSRPRLRNGIGAVTNPQARRHSSHGRCVGRAPAREHGLGAAS